MLCHRQDLKVNKAKMQVTVDLLKYTEVIPSEFVMGKKASMGTLLMFRGSRQGPKRNEGIGTGSLQVNGFC